MYREMRDAVAATEREINQLDGASAAKAGEHAAAPATERSPGHDILVWARGGGRTPIGAAVVACERLPEVRERVILVWRGTGISRCCSGCVRTATLGPRKRARVRRGKDTSIFCSGRALTAVRGTRRHAQTRHGTGTSGCCSGHTRTAVRGMQRRAFS